MMDRLLQIQLNGKIAMASIRAKYYNYGGFMSRHILRASSKGDGAAKCGESQSHRVTGVDVGTGKRDRNTASDKRKATFSFVTLLFA